MEVQFKSVEQAFQYTKTFYSAAPPGELEVLRDKILATTDGAMLRRLGRSVPSLDVGQWDADKASIMHDYVFESFRQNPEAMSGLVSTGDSVLTHTQARDEWSELFPKILMQVREELGAGTRVRPEVSLSTHFLRKDEPQRTPDVAYFFTDNAEAYMFSHGMKGWERMGPYSLAPKINVSDCDGHNQAGIRTGSDGRVTPNAYGIVVKKYQQDDQGRFVAQEGCFSETREDFEIFKRLNEYSFGSVREGRIVFPTQMGLSKSALPLPFARWMQAEVARRFDIVSQIEENGNTWYKGYGLRITEIDPVKARAIVDSYVEEPLGGERKPGYSLRFTESRGGFAERTHENANAPDVDFTFAFATDWSTAGEKCTARAAGNSIVQVDLPVLGKGGLDLSRKTVMEACDYITECLPEYAFSGSGIGLNLAGNGIYTLTKSGVTQEQVDVFVTAVFKEMVARGLSLESVRSGGQTGVDESAQAVGFALDVPVTIHAPRNFTFRNLYNVNCYGRDAFVKRYSEKDVKSVVRKADAVLSAKTVRKSLSVSIG